MNEDKWDAIAAAFERGEWQPANGIDVWRDEAFREAVTIRRALPATVQSILEVGCGVGRLTPHLAVLFGSGVVAVDTSANCRRVTSFACHHLRNVVVCQPGEPLTGQPDAALVWKLYDEDWSLPERDEHLNEMQAAYRYVLHSNNGVEHWLYER